MLSTDADQAIFFFILAPKDEAVRRFSAVMCAGLSSDCPEELGYELDSAGEWTVFADYVAEEPWHYAEGSQTAEIAQTCDAVYAYYSTDSCGGVLRILQNGAVIRDLFDYPDNDPLAEENRNNGLLKYEAESPITSWVDIIGYIQYLLAGNPVS